MVTLADIERAAWAASGWSEDQTVVDELVKMAEQYAHGHCGGDLSTGELTEVEVVAAKPEPVAPEPASEAAALDAVGVSAEWTGRGELEPGDEWKTCRKCGETKARNANFAPSKSSTTGYLARCRPCMKEDRRRYNAGRTK